MDSVPTENLVLAAIGTDTTPHSSGNKTESVSLSAVTEAVTVGQQQLSKQVEIAVAVETLTEDGLLNRQTGESEERLELTERGQDRAREIRTQLSRTEIELVGNGAPRSLPLDEAATELDRSIVEIIVECSEDGIYYLHDEVPTVELVGRDSDREELEEIFDQTVSDRQGRVVVLSGASGVGKTTLVDTVLEQTSDAVDVLRIHCQEAGDEPYQPIRNALEQYGSENPFERVDFDAEDPESYEANQTALFHDVTEILTPEEGIQVLFLDDIDRADTATWTYLRYLCDRIRDLPILLIGTHRPGTLPEETPISPGADAESGDDEMPITRFTLTGLDRDNTEKLIAQILNRREIPDEFIGAIYERTDGNPLFVETTIDTLLESNQLDAQFQWYPEDMDAIDLPDAVQDTVVERLDSLGAETRSVLEWAAVAGESLPKQLLQALSELSADHVGAIVETLVEAKMLIEELRGEGRYVTIRNDVVREALIDSLDSAEKKQRHAAIATTLENMAGSDSTEGMTDPIEHVSMIAYHYEQADNETAAIEWYRKAAEQSTDIYAHETATDHYHRILDIARAIGDEEAMLSAGHDLAEISLTTSEYDQAERYVQFVRERTPAEQTRRRRENARLTAEIAIQRGEFTAAVDAASEGLALTEESDLVQCRLLAVKAEAEWRQSEYDLAEETCEQFRELAEALGESSLEAEASEQFAMIAQERSDHERARENYEQALEKARNIGDRHHEARILNGLGIVADNQSRLDQSREYYEQALELFEEIGDRHQAAKLYNNLANIANSNGKMKQARAYYQRALETAEAVEDQNLTAAVRTNIGIIDARQADYTSARAYQDGGIEAFQEMDDDHSAAVAMLFRGHTSFFEGEYEQAGEYYQEALPTFRDVGDDIRITDTQCWLADLETERGEFDQAEAHIASARETTADHDNQTLQADISVSQSRLALWQGDTETARVEATEALDIYRESGSKDQVVNALYTQGVAALEEADYEQARNSLEEATEISKSLSDQRKTAMANRERGRIALEEEEYERARELFETALETLEITGVTDETARTRYELGRLASMADSPAQARQHWEQALATFEEIGARADAVNTLEALVSHCREEAPTAAEEWCDRGLELTDEWEADIAAKKAEWFREQQESILD